MPSADPREDGEAEDAEASGRAPVVAAGCVGTARAFGASATAAGPHGRSAIQLIVRLSPPTGGSDEIGDSDRGCPGRKQRLLPVSAIGAWPSSAATEAHSMRPPPAFRARTA